MRHVFSYITVFTFTALILALLLLPHPPFQHYDLFEAHLLLIFVNFCFVLVLALPFESFFIDFFNTFCIATVSNRDFFLTTVHVDKN